MNIDKSDTTMNFHVFCVDTKPFVVWDSGLSNFDAEYINSINPKFYEFIARQNYNVIIDKEADKESKQFAAILLRNYYTQALETLFALIFASLQSPKCVSGWMLKYWNSDLYRLVEKVNNKCSIKIRFDIKEKFDWETIIKIIFDYLDDNTENKPVIIKNYTELLTSFANDYLDKNLRNEYNSVKHGFRAQPGGFTLAIKPPDKNNDDKPKSDWINVSQSKYGSAFYMEEKIQDRKNQYCLKYNALNWNPGNIYHGICFISILMNNVLTFLKLFNHFKNEAIQYNTELSGEVLHSSWISFPNSGAFTIAVKVDIDSIPEITEKQILTSYYDTITKNK